MVATTHDITYRPRPTDRAASARRALPLPGPCCVLGAAMDCVICGQDKPAERIRYKTCCAECHREFMRRNSAQKKANAQAKRAEKQCPICGEIFRPCKPTSKTCSRKCANTLVSRETADQRSRVLRGRVIRPFTDEHKRRLSEAQQRRRSLSGEPRERKRWIVVPRVRETRTDLKSYRKLNGRHEHRVLMEQMLGRELMPGEIVHHKDGNKLNNDLSNLELLPSQAEHCRGHATKNRKCEVPGCSEKHFCKGKCRVHYRQWIKEVKQNANQGR